MNGRTVIVRNYMGDLLVITSYMVNGYLSNQTVLSGSQYVVKLHMWKKYQEAMLRNDLERVSTWYSTHLPFPFVKTSLLMRTRIGN